MTDAERFLLALSRDDMPQDERMILCAFVGDPNTAGTHAWRPRPYKPGNEIVIHERANGYVTVASFKKAQDGTFRRRQDCFGAGLALMVDDIGTKVDAKSSWPRASIEVETSPGNFQWWYLLSERCTDIERFDGVIRAFIEGQLLGADPGMAGVTRVGRLPGFVNGKPKYFADGKPWICMMREFEPERRYSIDDLLRSFDLEITGSKYAGKKTQLITPETYERSKQFADFYKFLHRRGMVKSKHGPDRSGWIQIHCPWTDEHTGSADTGAAIREPAPENDGYGAFRCHHGHCQSRGWSDLTSWINSEATTELAEVNDPGFDALGDIV